MSKACDYTDIDMEDLAKLSEILVGAHTSRKHLCYFSAPTSNTHAIYPKYHKKACYYLYKSMVVVL